MDTISAWNPQTVVTWLKGLDPALQDYPFETWCLTGKELLHVSYRDLEELGMHLVGHQELLLEAVEQLCVLNYELETSNLRMLTEKLQGVVRTIEVFILSHRKVSNYDGVAMAKPSLDLLAYVVELIGAAKGLFLWLNRYFFSRLNDYSASRDIICLCGDLAETMQKDCTVSEREDRILLIGSHISGICEHILNCSPATLLDQTAILERVELEPVGPEDSLGLEIKSSPSCLHFISGTAPESSTEHCHRVLPGDEIVQVNNQVVVGWTRMNLVKKLLETPSRVCLVLKKIPLGFSGPPSSPGSPSPEQQALGSFLDAGEVLRWRDEESPLSSASLISSMAAELEECLDSALDHGKQLEEIAPRHLTGTAWDVVEEFPGAATSLDPALEGHGFLARSESDSPPLAASTPTKPNTLDLGVLDSTTPENGFIRGSLGLASADPSKQDSAECGRKQKGATTRLSRRRISCLELGQVDCDGWLLKKKHNVGFMAQKWKRFWFVLKGQSLYWYSNPNDEKAVGLINVSAYRLESTKEQKKKYVFQLTHEKYKPFIFAAETLADLSMWVSHLITSMMKYTPVHKATVHSQEDCYSETEAEDPEDDSPKHSFDLPKRREGDSDQLFSGAAGSNASPSGSLLDSPFLMPKADERTLSPSPSDPSGEELESLIKCLKQGGVSLIGKQQVFTREQYRKSFVKRNKNPEINEKVHLIRTLQSTLKAKIAELQLLDNLLDDSELTSQKFRHWKEQHQELYQEITTWWSQQASQKDNASTPLLSDISSEDVAAATAATP